MRLARPETDATQHWDLVDKVARLEKSTPRALTTVIPSTAPVSVVDLGAVDGPNITGVRVTGNLKTAGTGGNTVIRLRPNGLSSISVLAMAHIAIWNTAATSTDLTAYAANFANAGGMMVAGHGWASSSNGVKFSGVLYTDRLAGADNRVYLGQYTNHDLITNTQQHSFATVTSQWNDTSTDVTSLALAIDAGTFYGKIVVEVVP